MTTYQNVLGLCCLTGQTTFTNIPPALLGFAGIGEEKEDEALAPRPPYMDLCVAGNSPLHDA